MIKKDETYLFHYTKMDILIKYILPERQIRFSTFMNMNDPKEAMPPYIKFTREYSRKTNGSLEFAELVSVKTDKFRRAYGENFKIGCFSISNDTLNNNLDYGQFKLRMWAQYADNHRGVCICFNKGKLLSGIFKKYGPSNVFHSRVNYSNDIWEVKSYLECNIDECSFDKIIIENLQYLFFTKAKDWESEKEYRIVINSATEEFAYIDIVDSIECIYIVESADLNNLKEIEKYIDNNKIDRICLYNGYPL